MAYQIVAFYYFRSSWYGRITKLKYNLMSLAVFYCLANILLFTLLFIYSTSYIASKSKKNISAIKKHTKHNLERIYNLSSYKDSVHN